MSLSPSLCQDGAQCHAGDDHSIPAASASLAHALEESRAPLSPHDTSSSSSSPIIAHRLRLTDRRKAYQEYRSLRHQYESLRKLKLRASIVARHLGGIVRHLEVAEAARSDKLVCQRCGQHLGVPYVVQRCSHVFCGNCLTTAFKARILSALRGNPSLPPDLRQLPEPMTAAFIRRLRVMYRMPLLWCPRCRGGSLIREAPAAVPLLTSLSGILANAVGTEDDETWKLECCDDTLDAFAATAPSREQLLILGIALCARSNPRAYRSTTTEQRPTIVPRFQRTNGNFNGIWRQVYKFVRVEKLIEVFTIWFCGVSAQNYVQEFLHWFSPQPQRCFA
ncbi:hypothetical protein OF83DRAFT_1084766 [Amylostereum chailletii]|nr:hypothetical protein OF83DRAFT_1084766 [Amylostereum chailletii]